MCISRSVIHKEPNESTRFLAIMYPIGTAGPKMNYYVPIQGDQANNANTFASKASSESRRATYILGRRYALTSTCYKYVEIGIRVGPVPCVEIILGDTRGNRLILSHQTWKELMNKRTDINQRLQSAETTPFWSRDLSIAMVKFQNVKVVKLTIFDASLYFKRETLDKLFDLEICINNVYSWLCDNTHIVTEQFKKFVDILMQKNFTEECYSLKTVNWSYAAQAIRDSDDFDCNSLIDCELVSCALNEIVHEALGN